MLCSNTCVNPGSYLHRASKLLGVRIFWNNDILAALREVIFDRKCYLSNWLSLFVDYAKLVFTRLDPEQMMICSLWKPSEADSVYLEVHSVKLCIFIYYAN